LLKGLEMCMQETLTQESTGNVRDNKVDLSYSAKRDYVVII